MPMIAAAPNSRAFVALLEAFRATGGTAPGDIVGRLLEDYVATAAVSLAKLVYTGQVFGFEWRSSLWIPMFQFDADSLVVQRGPQQARAELPPLWPGWTVASWFATPHAMLGGQRPVDALHLQLEDVLHAARSAAAEAAGQVQGLPRQVRRTRETTAHT